MQRSAGRARVFEFVYVVDSTLAYGAPMAAPPQTPPGVGRAFKAASHLPVEVSLLAHALHICPVAVADGSETWASGVMLTL